VPAERSRTDLLTSELKTAFQIGFMVFIRSWSSTSVASVLMSMGMMMLSPTLVSLPFKIMLSWWSTGGHCSSEPSPAAFIDDAENVMDLAHSTLTVTVMIAAPLLLTALITGLLIGMRCGRDADQRGNLELIPKLLVLVLALFVSGPWILRVLIDFTRELYAGIPGMIG